MHGGYVGSIQVLRGSHSSRDTVHGSASFKNRVTGPRSKIQNKLKTEEDKKTRKKRW